MDAMDQSLAIFGISNGALAAEQLPSTLTLLKWGENQTDRGVFVVNDETLSAMAAQRAGGIFERVLLDFEHNSLKGHPNYQPPPRKHAAAGEAFCGRDEGLCMKAVQWTPSGREHAKDYPDLSPALLFRKEGEKFVVLGLVSAALVPNGGVVGLSFFSAQPKQEIAAMDPEMKARIEALESALAALQEKLTQRESEIAWLKNDNADLRAQVDARAKAEAVTAMGAELTAVRKDRVLDRAAAAGKVVALAADVVAGMTVEQLDAHVAGLQATVPLRQETPAAGAGEPAQPASALSATQRSVARQLGLDAQAVFGTR